MKLTCGLTFTLPMMVVLLLLVVATKGHTVLQCYVCDNCEKVNKLTPLEQCGGENFSTTTTQRTSMSPSDSTSTTTSSSENFSTTTMRSTPMPTRDSTVKPSTEVPITTNSTVVDLTTPPSIINLPFSAITPSTTTAHTIVLDNQNATSNASSTTPSSFSEESFSIDPETDFSIASENFSEGIHNRQRRHTEFNGITFYCYKIQKKYDHGFGTKRGCIGVKTELSVCDQLDSTHNNQTSKCSPCTTTMCNGSSAIGVSIATLLVALVALIYKV